MRRSADIARDTRRDTSRDIARDAARDMASGAATCTRAGPSRAAPPSDAAGVVIGQHLPPDHSRGDETTLGGYAAVHGRPPAFEGADGAAYSADILVDDTGDPVNAWGAYLFFVRWSAGVPALDGHIESEFLTRAPAEADARAQLAAWSLAAVKRTLDSLIRARGTV